MKGAGPQAAKVKGGAANAASADKPLEYGTKSQDFSQSLNAYESQLKKGQYMNGAQLTSLDKEAYEALKPNAHQLSPLTHPHVFAWYSLVCKFSPAMMNNFPVVEGSAPAKKADKKAAAKKDEEELDDLFGDDDEGDAAAAKAAAEAAKAKAKKPKKKVIAMSLVMLEVKPLDDTIDLDALAQKMFSEITQEGLFWKTEFKKEPVAFGIFKLIVGFSLEDEKVSVDDIVEKIESMEDFVQSVEIAAFNKI
jgi:elongation factor 1-beta